MDLMNFEPSQAADMLGPVLVERAVDDAPLFGPDQADLNFIVEKATNSPVTSGLVQDLDAGDRPLPEALRNGSTTAEKLRALRVYVKEGKPAQTSVDNVAEATDDMSLSATGPPASSEIYEELLSTLIEAEGLPREARAVIDHAMLLRAKEKYLFDPAKNREVVDDDPWLRYLWGWIGGELAPTDYCYIERD